MPETTGKVFALTLFRWLYEWIWPPLKFTVQTSETSDIRRFYLENSSAARYLLQQIFQEKSDFKGEEPIPWHAQSRGRTDRMDWCEYWEILDLYILMGEPVFKWMFCKFAPDKDVGDCSHPGHQESVWLPAGSVSSPTMQKATKDLHTTQTAQLSSGRFSRPALIYCSYQGYGTQQSNSEAFHECKHEVKAIIVDHLKDTKVLNTVKWYKQRH